MFLAVVVAGWSRPAAADTIAEWIGRGYVARLTVRAVGPFRGCRAKLVVRLADNDSLACDFVNSAYSYNPSFTLLQNLATGDNVLVSGGTEYVGTLLLGRAGLLGKQIHVGTTLEVAGPARSAAMLRATESLEPDVADPATGPVGEPSAADQPAVIVPTTRH